MEMTLSSSNLFFLLYDYHQTAEISVIWRAELLKEERRF